MSRRTHQVEDLVRAELSDILLREVRDPRLRLVSVSRVALSGDLQHATVHVSALGLEPSPEERIAALARAGSFLRSKLARRLRHLRRIPELRFELDRGPEHGQRIHELLENLHEPDDTA